MIQLNDDYDKRIQNTLRQNARGVQDLHAAQQLGLTGTLANPFLKSFFLASLLSREWENRDYRPTYTTFRANRAHSSYLTRSPVTSSLTWCADIIPTDRQREEATMHSQAEVAITNTRGAAVVAKTKATGQKQIALAKALEARNALVERVKADKDARVVGVNQEYTSAVTRAVAGLAVAKAKAQEIDADADAEAEASVRLAVSRDHEVQELRIAALRRIAKSAKVVVGGATGEGLLAQIAPGSVTDLSADAAS